MSTNQDAHSAETAEIRALREAHRDAVTDMIADADYWERVASGQDSEESEESGRLAGFAEGLETALNILGATINANSPGPHLPDGWRDARKG